MHQLGHRGGPDETQTGALWEGLSGNGGHYLPQCPRHSIMAILGPRITISETLPTWFGARAGLNESLGNFDFLGSACWTHFPHSAHADLQKCLKQQGPWDKSGKMTRREGKHELVTNLQSHALVYTGAQFSLLVPAHKKDHK